MSGSSTSSPATGKTEEESEHANKTREGDLVMAAERGKCADL